MFTSVTVRNNQLYDKLNEQHEIYCRHLRYYLTLGSDYKTNLVRALSGDAASLQIIDDLKPFRCLSTIHFSWTVALPPLHSNIHPSIHPSSLGLFNTQPGIVQNNGLWGFSDPLLFSLKCNLLISQQTTYRLWFGNASSLNSLSSVAQN